jgi:hypothetical protein
MLSHHLEISMSGYCHTTLDRFVKDFIQKLQADRAYGTEISPRPFVISFVITIICNIVQYLYLLICHYVSCRVKEIADASMQAAESHC